MVDNISKLGVRKIACGTVNTVALTNSGTPLWDQYTSAHQRLLRRGVDIRF